MKEKVTRVICHLTSRGWWCGCNGAKTSSKPHTFLLDPWSSPSLLSRLRVVLLSTKAPIHRSSHAAVASSWLGGSFGTAMERLFSSCEKRLEKDVTARQCGLEWLTSKEQTRSSPHQPDSILKYPLSSFPPSLSHRHPSSNTFHMSRLGSWSKFVLFIAPWVQSLILRKTRVQWYR